MKIIKYAIVIAAVGIAVFVIMDRFVSENSGGSLESSLPRMAEQTSVEVVEDCPLGRCPCMTSRIRQTSVPAGWAKLIKPKFSAYRCDPPPSGYRADIYHRTKCVICPTGMQYSGLLQNSPQIKNRAKLAEDQCVSIQRTCLDKTPP